MSGIGLFIDRTGRNRCSPDFMESLLPFVGGEGAVRIGSWASADHAMGMIAGHTAVSGTRGELPAILWNEAQTLGVLLNGTLFNYFDLRAEAERDGVSFHTALQEEALLYAYETLGTECLRHLDGMFSLMIIDLRYNQILYARDSFGKKPLYFYEGGDWFAAASDMQTLLQGVPGPGNWKCNDDGLSDYLIFGYGVRNRTLVQGIKKILPGEVLLSSLTGETVHRWRYWSLPAVNPFFGGNVEEVYRRFKVRFEASVERELGASDGQVDLLLSGGVDSTAVFCAAAEQGFLPNIFTLRAANMPECASYDVESLARSIGVKCDILDTPSLSPQTLVDAIAAFDEPYSNQDAVGIHLLSAHIAASGRRAALIGDGGSELMIGYNHYREYVECRSQQNSRWWIPFGDFLRNVPTTQSLILNWAQLYTERFAKTPQWIRRLLLEESFQRTENSSVQLIRQTMQDQVGRTAYDFLSRFDYHFGLPDDILVKADRCGVRHNIELRTPMIDRDLTAYIITLPEEVRLYYEKEPKWMLRRYIRESGGDAPWVQNVMHRSRHAFSVSLTQTMHRLWEQSSQWVFDDDFLWWTSLRRHGVEQAMVRKGTSRSLSRSGWTLFCLYIWWRKYICNNPIQLS